MGNTFEGVAVKRSDILRSLGFVLAVLLVLWMFKFMGAADSTLRVVSFYTLTALYAAVLVHSWVQMTFSVVLYALAITLDSQLSMYAITEPQASESVFFSIGAGVVLLLFMAIVYNLKGQN